MKIINLDQTFAQFLCKDYQGKLSELVPDIQGKSIKLMVHDVTATTSELHRLLTYVCSDFTHDVKEADIQWIIHCLKVLDMKHDTDGVMDIIREINASSDDEVNWVHLSHTAKSSIGEIEGVTEYFQLTTSILDLRWYPNGYRNFALKDTLIIKIKLSAFDYLMSQMRLNDDFKIIDLNVIII